MMDDKSDFYPASVSRAQRELYAKQAGEKAHDAFLHSPDWQDVADEALPDEIVNILYMVWADDMEKAKAGLLQIIERKATIIAEREEAYDLE